jgi:uncharacterized protein YbjQ (UPF0145 family)
MHVISSGAICEKYQTLGLVVGFASTTQGCQGKMNIEGTYKRALQRLVESAKSQGANGVIFVNFQNRVAWAPACMGSNQVFEVFSWGTAIRL